jgi:hypothetical protein
MTSSFQSLYSAAKMALKLRVSAGYSLEQRCDVYELIASTGLDLQFVDIPSLEGMYLSEEEVHRICVCAHRPAARQRFTAAHEFGHHVLGHGTQIDLSDELRGHISADSEENEADVFASYLLMPSRAVHYALRSRDIELHRATARDLYGIACWLGAGYESLLVHMDRTLGLLERANLECLRKTSVKQIKSILVGREVAGDVWPIDRMWGGQVLHCQQGDLITGLYRECAPVIRQVGDGIWEASMVGRSRALITASDWVDINVSRRAYVGFYAYRYLEE